MKKMTSLALALLFLIVFTQPAFAAPLNVPELTVAVGEKVSLSWTQSGALPRQYVVRLYEGDALAAKKTLDGNSRKYSIPASFISREGTYTVRLTAIGGDASVSVSYEFSVCKSNDCKLTITPTAKPNPTVQPTPRPTAAPTQRPAAPNPGSTSASMAEEVIRQVNMERAARGLPALRVDPDLTAAACVRAKEIVGKFSHTRPDGTHWSTVSKKATGENIARGHGSVDRVMAAWMSSEGHRNTLLRKSVSTTGVCAYKVDGVMHWVQLFGP